MVRRTMLLNAHVTGNKELASRHVDMLQNVLKLATSWSGGPSQPSTALLLPHILVDHVSGTGGLLLVELHLADDFSLPLGAGTQPGAVETALKQCRAVLGPDAQPADHRADRCSRFMMSSRTNTSFSHMLRSAPAFGRLGVRAITVCGLSSASCAPSPRDGVLATKTNVRERAVLTAGGGGPADWRTWALQSTTGDCPGLGNEYANWPVAYIGSDQSHALTLLDRLISSSEAANINSLRDLGALLS